jgi:beta-xylosidase
MHFGPKWTVPPKQAYRLLLLVALVVLSACGQQNQTSMAQVASPAATAQNSGSNTAAPVPQTPALAAPAVSTATHAPAPATSAVSTATHAPAPAASAVSTSTEVSSTLSVESLPQTATLTTMSEPTPGPGQFVNPVLQVDFPDPDAIKAGDTYYAYATQGGSSNIQMAKSKDLVHWDLLQDPLPDLPPWALRGKTWAPEVIALADGKSYALYFTAHDKASNKQCVGVATSDKSEGPFKSSAQQPLVCQVDLGGTIDPSPLRDGAKLYLYFKNDGNCCGMETDLFVQELSPDGLKVVGQPVKLASNDSAWEGPVVEAPQMVKHDGKYFLFFSGNKYEGTDYAVGYALCQSATGPCQDAPENPILKTVSDPEAVIGPGHEAIVNFGDQTWLLYHAWEVVPGVGVTQRRLLYLDRVDWKNGKPVVHGPTTRPQPLPGK